MDQIVKLQEMQENYLTMIDFQNVLQNVQYIIPRIQGAGVVRHGAHGSIIDEERKDVSINEEHKQSVGDMLDV